MPDEPSAVANLSEARGAHTTSRQILGLLQEPGADPIEVIIAALRAIEETQRRILTRLDIIDRKLTERRGASPG